MVRKQWFVILPVLLLAGGAGGHALFAPMITRAESRIVDADFLRMEGKAGRHLYAPTWLPYDGRMGALGAKQGARRILQDYSDNRDRSLCILAQEPRSAERDRYHQRLFVKAAEATADLKGKKGYFITGTNGERRLFWNEKETAVILSSTVMTDEELADVAVKVR
jgi:hypothetical protein